MISLVCRVMYSGGISNDNTKRLLRLTSCVLQLSDSRAVQVQPQAGGCQGTRGCTEKGACTKTQGSTTERLAKQPGSNSWAGQGRFNPRSLPKDQHPPPVTPALALRLLLLAGNPSHATIFL